VSLFPSNHTELINNLLAKSITQQTDEITRDVNSSTDLISLIICLRIIEKAKLNNTNQLKCLRIFHEKVVNVFLLPRIKHLLEIQSNSLKKFTDPSSNATVLSTHTNTQPHFITRRYADLLSAILAITNPESLGIFQSLISEFTRNYEIFLVYFSKKLPTKQDELVFNLNNYDLILGTMKQHKLSSDERQVVVELVKSYEDKIKANTSTFVETQLNQYLSTKGIIQFAIQREQKKTSEADSKQLSKQFKENWRSDMMKIKQYIMGSFTNYVNGNEIFKQIGTQLLLYYTRFHKLLDNAGKEDLNPQDLMNELKQITTNI
jgi:Vps52 / Sac2 family